MAISHPPSAFASINPATEVEVERFTPHTGSEVESRLALAYAAYSDWSRWDLERRLTLIRELPNVLRRNIDRYAQRITAEMGKPIAEARNEINKCAVSCEYLADAAPRALADIPAPSDSSRSFVAYRPLGPVLAVMPWNYPFWQVLRAAVPAMCAGNVVILKHAPNVLGCATEIEGLFTEAGFPAGVLTNLFIDVPDVERVIADPRIAAVTLTGSERAGIAVARLAGASLKKAVLELGGSDAFVVLRDADVTVAAKVGAGGRFLNAGQSCIAAKRFIVEQPCVADFAEALVAQGEQLRIGDPALEETTLGPLAREDLRANLERQLNDTVAAGARVLTGGNRPQPKGWFIEPTVLDRVTSDMVSAREETFGPLASIIAVEDENEALRVANDSRFGLGGSLWTADVEHGLELASRFESGGVFINGLTHSDARIPFGGIKHSGFGRELSEFGIREFTNVQTVWLPG
jgi:succinate-semialdehyde dehydrogenase/glutarate-semialdehyde dehydrogenase